MADIEVVLTGIGRRAPHLERQSEQWRWRGGLDASTLWRVYLDGDPDAYGSDRGDNISADATLADWQQFASDLAEVIDDMARAVAASARAEVPVSQ